MASCDLTTIIHLENHPRTHPHSHTMPCHNKLLFDGWSVLFVVGNEKPQRRGSVGSLDSGMSISFQSTSASTGSRSDIKVRMLPHSNTSGQIIMHAGQHATALMGAIYHQQIVQQHVPPAAAVPPPTQPINGQLPQSQQVVAATQPNQLTAASAQPMTRRERKLSRSEDSATMAAANGNASGPAAAGPNYGRSTEV